MHTRRTRMYTSSRWSYTPMLITLATICLHVGTTSNADQRGTPCRLDDHLNLGDYFRCIRARSKRQCDPSDPFGPCAEPCRNYYTIINPARRVGNRIDRLTDSALCDRALLRRWYRFESEAGGKIPENCVEEYSCGTHVPIWLNGEHPQRSGELRDVEVCASRGGECCHSRWYIRVANCGDFYTYLLHETRGCYQAYCVGGELPCPPGQSSPTGFSPGCTDDFPALPGQAMLRVGTEADSVAFYCDYEGSIPTNVQIEVHWYVRGDSDPGEVPVFRDTLRDQPRSILTEGHWERKVGSVVWCVMKAVRNDGTGVPSLPVKSEEYFAGIRVNRRTVNVSESEEETEIEVQSTLPVACLPQFSDVCKLSIQVAHDATYASKRCVDGRMRQIVFGECTLDLTPDNWQQPQTIKVKAVRDFYNDGTKRMLVDFRPIYTTYLSQFWNNYEIPTVEVLSTDIHTKMCSSTGDPHLMTFDGLYYHVYLEGEFVLYKHKSLPLQINVRLERCAKTVSCNCGIAVKAGDDVIVVDRCQRRSRNEAFGAQFPDGWRTLHRHALEQGSDWVHGLHLYEYDGGKRFSVHLPTGAYIDFQIGERDWINLYMYGSSDDWLKTQGLCGTFDDNVANDLELPDGVTTVPARDQAKCGTDPDMCRFAEAWRVSEEDSFFGEEVVVDLQSHDFSAKQRQYCKCEEDAITRDPVVVCNYNYDVDNCHARMEQRSGVDRTADLVGRHRQRRSVEPHDEDDDYFQAQFVYDPGFQGQETAWPTPNGITEAHAQRHCQQYILDAPVYNVCEDFIAPRLHALIDECKIDVKVNDDLAWAQSALDSVTSECADAIHVDATLWGVDPEDIGPSEPEVGPSGSVLFSSTAGPATTTVVPRPSVGPETTLGESLLKQVCPSDCSRHGRCVAGKCQCSQDYVGQDCSLRHTQPPLVHHLSGGGLCDVSNKACRQIRVYGSRFRNTTGLTCTLQELMFDEGAVSATLMAVQTPAQFDTFEEILCPVPQGNILQGNSSSHGSVRAFEVSVANDDGAATPPLVWVAYHSACQQCVINGRNTTCRQKTDGCEVGGQCFPMGEKNPENCCEVCQPDVAVDRFTQFMENRRPRLIPWRSTYEVPKGSEWDLTIRGTDPEGCGVTLTATSARQRPLSATVENNEVHLRLNSERIGQYKATVRAEDECGESYSQLYHVMVTRK